MATVTRNAELLTVDGVVGFTPSLASNSHVFRASCQVIRGAVRVSVRPDQAVYFVLQQGQTFYVTGQPDLSNFRAIQVSETTPLVAVNYEGTGGVE